MARKKNKERTDSIRLKKRFATMDFYRIIDGGLDLVNKYLEYGKVDCVDRMGNTFLHFMVERYIKSIEHLQVGYI